MLIFSKRKKKARQFFNMVEVTLALGVSAVGVSAAMGILPFAMKTSQSISQNSNATDVANTIFTELNRQVAIAALDDKAVEKGILEVIKDTVGKDGIEPNFNYDNSTRNNSKFSGVAYIFRGAADEKDEVTKLPTYSGTISLYHHTANDPEGGKNWEPAHRDKAGDYKDKAEIIKPGQNTVVPFFDAKYKITVTDVENDQTDYTDQMIYFVGQKGNDTVTVTVTNPRTGEESKKKEEIPTALTPRNISLKENFNEGDNPLKDQYRGDKARMKRVYVEISWPATAVLSKRKKKVFVQELYLY